MFNYGGCVSKGLGGGVPPLIPSKVRTRKCMRTLEGWCQGPWRNAILIWWYGNMNMMGCYWDDFPSRYTRWGGEDCYSMVMFWSGRLCHSFWWNRHFCRSQQADQGGGVSKLIWSYEHYSGLLLNLITHSYHIIYRNNIHTNTKAPLKNNNPKTM